MRTCDVAILGGGTAGTAAARAVHEEGGRAVVFNAGELGGLCILRGCMPTKTMLHAAHLAHEPLHHRTPGVRAGALEIDFAAVMRNKDAKVERFQRAKVRSIESGGYELVRARARFVGDDEVEAGGERWRFERGAVIATGSIPFAPPIDGLDGVPWMSSDEALRLTERPASMIVIGSGAVGLELAQFFARMGTRVELVSRRRVFEDVDPAIVEEIEAVLRDEPSLVLHSPQPIENAHPTARGVRLELASGRVVEAETLLVATGRAPDVADLGLDAAGVRVENGRPAHGADLRTTNPRVFVAGDVSGDRLLLHVANWEGEVAGRNALEPGRSETLEDRIDLEVVFTDPPLAILGWNEARAREKGREVATSIVRFPETGRAITQDVAHGVSKLVADADTGRLIGAQILGPRADDLAHVIAALVLGGVTVERMLDMPWYHPTFSEVFLSQARELRAAIRRRAGSPA